MNWLIALMPSSLAILLVTALAIGMISGLVRPSIAFSIFGAFVLWNLLEPFIASFMSGLPAWLILIGAVLLGMRLLRGLGALAFGDRVVDHAAGALLARGLMFVLALPFKICGALLRAMFR